MKPEIQAAAETSASLQIGPLNTLIQPEKTRIEVPITLNDETISIYYETPSIPLNVGGDSAVALSLLPALRLGADLMISDPVSGRLLSAIPEIKAIYRHWYPGHQDATLRTSARAKASSGSAKGVACFFSGGVDSFYTLIKHLDEIDTLIFVHGFDIYLEKQDLRAEVSRNLNKIARALGKNLIEVETNLRLFSDRFSDWRHYHGAALASVGVLFSHQLSRIYVPSTYSYRWLVPLGSHPFLDSLWSTEAIEFVHDGIGASRDDKVALLSTVPVALETLRVCWENRNGAYNCGECEKCLRTMVSLRIAGALESCLSFDRPLDLQTLSTLRLRNQEALKFLRESLDQAEASGRDPELREAIVACLRLNTEEGAPTPKSSQPLTSGPEQPSEPKVEQAAPSILRRGARRMRRILRRALGL